MTTTFLRIAAGILTLLLYAGCASERTTSTVTHSDTSTPMAHEGGAAIASAPFDLQFIDTMTQHHQGAIDMAKMAQPKAQNPQIKAFAAQIIQDQQREISQMKQWRDTWYPGKSPAHNMEMPGMKASMEGMSHEEMQKMESLQGADFDHHFVDMMIPHHEGAISMAKEALSRAQHPELKQLAEQIIEAQKKEVALMSDLKTQFHLKEE